MSIIIVSCKTDDNKGSELFKSGLEEMLNNNLPSAYHLLKRAVVAYQEEADSIGCFQAKSHLGLVCASIGKPQEGYNMLKSTPYYHIKEKGNYRNSSDTAR